MTRASGVVLGAFGRMSEKSCLHERKLPKSLQVLLLTYESGGSGIDGFCTRGNLMICVEAEWNDLLWRDFYKLKFKLNTTDMKLKESK